MTFQGQVYYYLGDWGNTSIFHHSESYSVMATGRSRHQFHPLNSHMPTLEMDIQIPACVITRLYRLHAARIHFQSSEKSQPSVNLIID